MRHGYITTLDSMLRTLWYAQGRFPLGAALDCSARLGTYHTLNGHKYHKKVYQQPGRPYRLNNGRVVYTTQGEEP